MRPTKADDRADTAAAVQVGQHSPDLGPGGSPAPARRRDTDRLLELQEDQGLDIKEIHLWASSPERIWYLERREGLYRFVGAGCGLLAIALAVVLVGTPSRGRLFVGAVCGAVGFVVLIWCTVPYWSARRAFRERRKALAAYRVDVALRDVCDSDDPLSLAGLFELNRRQLDEYQIMTKRQQLAAFHLGWGASAVAFLVLIGGVVMSFQVNPGSQQYIVGGLTGLGALLSAFLGKVFFTGHQEAVKQLNYYYSEPSTTGRLLAAERVVTKLGHESRVEFARSLVERPLRDDPPGPVSAGQSDAGSEPDDGQEERATGKAVAGIPAQGSPSQSVL